MAETCFPRLSREPQVVEAYLLCRPFAWNYGIAEANRNRPPELQWAPEVTPPVSAADVGSAAETVLSAVQTELAARREETIHGWRRWELWLAQETALFAIADFETLAGARRVQATVAAGAPLAVCYGEQVWRVPESVRQGVRHLGGHPPGPWRCFPYGDGCGAVMTDSRRAVRKRYCADCQRRRPKRRRDEANERALLREAQGWYFDERRGLWGGPCVRCGTWSFDDTASARRCARCRW